MLSKEHWVKHLRELCRKDLFLDVQPKPKRFAQIQQLDSPNKRYVIFFTPRSGSSRLTDLAEKSKILGEPGECFNPAFVPNITKAYAARNLSEYVDFVMRVRSETGIFGCEVTFLHVLHTFHTTKQFVELTSPTSTLWLIREDIIAQAVSISRMMQTKVGHSVHAGQDAIAKADTVFKYREKELRNLIFRLRLMEVGTERLIKRHGFTPMRLTYEQCISLPERDLVRAIGKHVGAPVDQADLSSLTSDHKKLSGDKSKEFVERFRRKNRAIVEQLNRDRAQMLNAHAASTLI